MKKIQSLYKHLLDPGKIIYLVAGVFFVLAVYPYLFNGGIYSSPDETANAVFIQSFITSSDLHIPFGENPGNIIRPRSVNVIGSNYVPGSFLGLILFLGSIGKVVGMFGVKLLPALIASVALIAFYQLLQRVFSKETAFHSTLLGFFLPQWLYYASRGFLPNTIFLSLAIIALFLIVLAHEQKKSSRTVLWAGVAGLCLAVSLAIRPSEVWWGALILIPLAIVYRKNSSWKVVTSLLSCVILPMLFIGYWQDQTFGGALANGYQQFQSTSSGGGSILVYFFPFGFNLFGALTRFWNYLLFFWWQWALIIPGLVFFFQSDRTKAQNLYVTLLGVSSLYLVLFYGSWSLADHPDAQRVSMGVSYIRYWLPLYIGLLPFYAIGIKRVSGFVKVGKSLIPAAVLVLSLFYVYGYQDDHIGALQETIVNYKEIRESILQTTESDAIIIGERTDKIVWPERQVIHFQDQDYEFTSELPELTSNYPLYYLSILPRSHITVISERYFAPHNTSLEFIKELPLDFRLYRVKP